MVPLVTAALRLVQPEQGGEWGNDPSDGAPTISASLPFSMSAGQVEAAEKVRAWLRDPHRAPIFRLFGYAGTGKTSIAKMLAAEVKGGPVYCAFTGKAALRMRQTGCADASTIHRLIYKVSGEDGDTLRVTWQANSAASKAGIIVVDECSMVDEELARDLLRYGKPLLVLGDPFQLPPVRGRGYLTAAEPDAMLTEVHRQALDNPILRAATEIREGGSLQMGHHGALQVVERGTLSVGDACEFDQVLVGTHKLRRSYIKQMRKHEGRVGYFPEPGDRIICTRNHRKSGLFNGQVFKVIGSRTTAQCVNLRLIDEDDADAMVIDARCLQDGWRDPSWKPTPQQGAIYQQFDFAQAMTVHKAQGSEWGDVLVYDESAVFRNDAARWLYTAITRAANTLTVVV